MFYPYVHETAIIWFTKETDYLFRTKYGQLILAGFFRNMADEWVLLEHGNGAIVNPDNILRYMVIPKD